MNKRIFLFLGLSLVALGLTAQVNNYIGVYGNVGEASLLTSLPELPTSDAFGVGGGVGVTYELQAGKGSKQFLFTVGVGFDISQSSFDLSGGEQRYDAIDTENDPLSFIISPTARKDVYLNGALQVPVLLGGQFGRFYFLAGVKFDLSVLGTSSVKSTIRTIGDYPQFIDPFTSMPDHGFYDNQEMTPFKNKIHFEPNLKVSLELGGRFGVVTDHTGYDVPKPKVQYRLAAYVDYGVMDMLSPNRPTGEYFVWDGAVIDKDCLSHISMTDVLSTHQVKDALHNLQIGLKFTALFELPKRGACVICRDGYHR